MRKLISADKGEIELLRKHLFRAGIMAHVRYSLLLDVIRGKQRTPELWVKDDSDYVFAARLVRGLKKEPAGLRFESVSSAEG